MNWEKNPVKLSKADAEQIRVSIEKFGQVLPLVANAPAANGKRRLMDGHQRKSVELAARAWGADTEVDVRVPDRLLTAAECDELSLRLRRNHGETDYMKLLTNFDMDQLISAGFGESELAGYNFKNAKLVEKSVEIKPRKFLRILISVPVSKAAQIKKQVEAIEDISGVDVLYGAN